MMKKFLIILFCWTSTLAVFAQDTQPLSASNGTNEIRCLFSKGNGSCKIPLGYFIEANGGYTHFGHKSVFLPGISMGIILDHHWSVGIAGNFIVGPQGSHYHHSDSDSTGIKRHENSLTGGYGGLLLEYTLFPQSKVHLSFPLLIGCGAISSAHHEYNSDTVIVQNEGSHHNFSHMEHFFVLEPGVKLEFNVIKLMRVGLGISYRYSPGHDHLYTSPDMLNQLTGKISIRFGKF